MVWLLLSDNVNRRNPQQNAELVVNTLSAMGILLTPEVVRRERARGNVELLAKLPEDLMREVLRHVTEAEGSGDGRVVGGESVLS